MKQRGVIIVIDPDLPHEVQLETFTCSHCGHVGRVMSSLPRLATYIGIDVTPTPNDDGGWCFKCQAVICRKPACADHDDLIHPHFARLGFGWD